MTPDTLHLALTSSYWDSGANPLAMTSAVLHATGLPPGHGPDIRRVIEAWVNRPEPFGGMAQDIRRVVKGGAV
jgi:hypothetical protein